ncbi:MAG: DUF4392 domain-containing protein [Deltaproteobacteria bacterium]|nr:DUF4392 domain-containing protein [Deltaproteobacteria bacterium]
MKETEKTVEDIILSNDRKNIAVLKPYLPADFCGQATRLLEGQSGNILIVTGFVILAVGQPETDGPPGALAIGEALKKLGNKVYYVTDSFTAPLMQAFTSDPEDVITFPLTDPAASEQYARELLDRLHPPVVISIERCGLTEDGNYLNMARKDISQYNAKIDYLFYHHNRTIGIGDGGNEIGMGNLAQVIPGFDRLPPKPCLTKTTQLIIASVSNWGGYGLVAALSRQVKRNLLPSPADEKKLIARMVELGAVDGMKGERVDKVDGFSLEENAEVLVELHQWLKRQGVS